MRVFITGTGIISSAGKNLEQTLNFLKSEKIGIKPLTLFPAINKEILPVGQVNDELEKSLIPRTHKFALIAAKEALKHAKPPDAIILGTTTGGMPTTEEQLLIKHEKPDSFYYHSIGSVAEYIAKKTGCSGPVITISTACSSSAVAISIAFEMLKQNKFKKILAGGADSICRLTYFGFNSLQVIDPSGAKPFDLNRKGMTVAEGAGMLLLEASDDVPKNAIAEILGTGLSCDAYHPVSPHPEGKGAYHAMAHALKDADLKPSNIDYINMHGTGTIDNDLAEACAVNALFSEPKQPMLSSIKGLTGHCIAASGAVELIISANSIRNSLIPGNTGCNTPDPKLKLTPLKGTINKNINTVISNSFGFGGNNASIIIGKPLKKNSKNQANNTSDKIPLDFTIAGLSCITGAGDLNSTIKALKDNSSCKGMLSNAQISKDLKQKSIRRLNRLSRLALNLAENAFKNSKLFTKPSSVFLGTAWGPLSETYNFFEKLYKSETPLASPIDFTGSVHNAPAGQIAMHFNAKGPNITTSGVDYAFEQALFTAKTLSHKIDDIVLVVGVDETHEILSPISDPSITKKNIFSDGGGALCLKKQSAGLQKKLKKGLTIRPLFLKNFTNEPNKNDLNNTDSVIILDLINKLNGKHKVCEKYGAVFVGIPYALRKECEKQLKQFTKHTQYNNPIIDYRKFLGQYSSASAVATVLASQFMLNGEIPVFNGNNSIIKLKNKSILLLGLGNIITAIEVTI